MTNNLDWQLKLVVGVATFAAAVLVGSGTVQAGQAASDHDDVTFTKDIAPILQRSCQHCHQTDSVAPMSLITYSEVRPWARAMKLRTGMGPVAGVMPPWYIEKNIGIQEYQFDPSLSAEEIAKIGIWSDNGAPRGNPADMPPLKPTGGAGVWTAGEPDLITVLQDIVLKGDAPDWWGEIDNTPVGIDEDRYVKSIEFREINNVLDDLRAALDDFSEATVTVFSSGCISNPEGPGCSEALDEWLALDELVREITDVLEDLIIEHELCCGPWSG